MLYRQRNNYGRIFGALTFVDCRRIGEHQLVEFAKAVDRLAALEVDGDLAFPCPRSRAAARLKGTPLSSSFAFDPSTHWKTR